MAEPVPFGGYVLLDRIDVGGKAEVFIARRAGESASRRSVVVKRLLPVDAADRAPTHAFDDEVRAARHLEHPGIAALIEAGEAGGTLFAAVEHVDGKSLRQVLARCEAMGQSVPPQVACRILALACDALDYAHRAVGPDGSYLGLGQRALSPRKILIGFDGAVKLVGFASWRSTDVTGYSAPEQMRGTQVDWRADVFAVGAILYECVTGHPAYPGGAPVGDIVPPRSLEPGVPVVVERAVMRALAADPAARHQSCAELAAELRACVSEHGAEAPEVTAIAISGWLSSAFDRDEPDEILSGPPTARDMPAVPPPDTPVHVDENVQFSVYRPRAVTPAEWHPLLAFAHLAELPPDAPDDALDPIEEVERQAKQALGERAGDYRDVVVDSEQPVPREGEITFVPEIDGVTFNPPRRTFLWLESVHREEFRFRADRSLDGQTARGRLTAYLGNIILADVTLAIRVDAGVVVEPVSASSMQAARARPYRKIFASYSHRDIAIVEEFERHGRALGDEYLRDMIHLRSGEVWDSKLEQLIAKADLFQLFWSSNSMHSPFVRREWEHALSLGREGFIRPTYWEVPMPSDPAAGLPPPQLSRLHFQRLGAQDAVDEETPPVVPAGRPTPKPMATPVPKPARVLTCRRCGKSNQNHYKFCLGCGAELEPDGTGEELGAAKTVMGGVGAGPGGAGSMQSMYVGGGLPLGGPPGGGPAGGMPVPQSPPPLRQSAPPPRPSTPPPREPPPREPPPRAVPPCVSCGSPIAEGFKFCGSCGMPVTEMRPPITGAMLAQPQPAIPRARGALTLILPDGSRGDVLELGPGPNLIGRDADDAFASDFYLSPRHAELEIDDAGAVLRDLDSVNGVFVGLDGEEEIFGGQQFRIGNHVLRFDIIETSVPDVGGVEVLATLNPGYWGRVSVVIGAGTDAAAFALLADSVVFGRERGDVNFPTDGYISGRHAELVAHDGGVFLRDLGSSNGTFIRVQGERRLGDGARFMVGQQMFELSLA